MHFLSQVRRNGCCNVGELQGTIKTHPLGNRFPCENATNHTGESQKVPCRYPPLIHPIYHINSLPWGPCGCVNSVQPT